MKRKFAMTLCATACISMLFGCGQKESMNRLEEAASAMKSAEDNDAVSDSQNLMTEQEEGDSQETTTSTISEYLGNGRKILYKIAELDKERIPRNIYFFEDGKVTGLEGNELGLTIGELSRMTDDAIWDKMEECCAAKYDRLSDTLHQLQENKLKAGIMYMKLNEDGQDISSFAKDMVIQTYKLGFLVELPAYSTADDTTLEYWEEWADSFPEGRDGIEKTGEEVYSQMESCMPKIKGLGCNVPVVFIVQTDATGNNVDAELIVWMDVDGDTAKRIVIGGKNTTGSIYDSSYACYTTEDGDMLCVRDETEMVFDETGSGKAYVDIEVHDAKELLQQQ